MPDTDRPTIDITPGDVILNDDGTITLTAAFVTRVLEDPEVADAVTRRMADAGESRDDALRHIMSVGAREMIRQRALPDGSHRTRRYRP